MALFGPYPDPVRLLAPVPGISRNDGSKRIVKSSLQYLGTGNKIMAGAALAVRNDELRLLMAEFLRCSKDGKLPKTPHFTVTVAAASSSWLVFMSEVYVTCRGGSEETGSGQQRLTLE